MQLICGLIIDGHSRPSIKMMMCWTLNLIGVGGCNNSFTF